MRNSVPLPLKTLVILDKDNCELDTLEVFGVLEETLAQLSAARGISLEILHDLVRDAEGEHRFNDAIGLINHMNEIEPQFKTDDENHIQADISAKEHWWKKTAELSRFYPGVLETLKTWHENGTNVVTKTDCERLPLIRRVWLTALNAHDLHDLGSPYEIISLYDRIYCKPSLGEPDNDAEFDNFLRKFCNVNSIPYAFAAALNQHITVFRDEHKPSRSHMEKILADFPTRRDHILYIGDNYKDGQEAMALSTPVDFAWAKYGAAWRPEVRDFYAKVGSKSYKYGTEEIRSSLDLHKVDIRLVLEKSLAETLEHFEFGPGWNLPRRPLSKAYDAQRAASRNLHIFRAARLDFSE